MDLKKSIKQGGFTLAEVMVTIAVLGILSFAVIDQVRLSNSSKRDSNERAIINNIQSRLAVEMSRQETCSSPSNLGGKTIGTALTSLVNAQGVEILRTGTSYGMFGIFASASKGANTVKVDSITTSAGATSNEVNLIVDFSVARGWFPPAFLSILNNRITLKLNKVSNTLTPNKIEYCFSDITSSITAAIRLSCVGNGSYVTEPTTGKPYGECVVGETVATTCGPGLYIQKFALSNGVIVPTCVGLTISCPIAGQVITGFNASGVPTCAWPFPTCPAGEIIVKSNLGRYVCTNASLGCSTNYAIKGWNADGTVNCQPLYPPTTCPSSYVIGTTAGAVTCGPGFVQPKTCPGGQYISGTDASNTPICTPYITPSFTCPAGQVSNGVLANGNLSCITPDRKLSCNGSISPTPKRFSDCVNAGGVVQNRDGGTNSYCKMPGSSCTGGFTACLSLGDSGTSAVSQCNDTNSGCSYSGNTPRYAYGTGVFQNPASGSQRQAQCYYWARNSGPWVKSCTGYYGAPWNVGPPSPITEVGCY